MYVVCEDNNSPDFDLELENEYKAANDYVNKNQDYYFGFYNVPFFGLVPKNPKALF